MLAAGIGALVPARHAAGAQDAAALRPQEGDLLVRADDAQRQPLRPSDIPLNAHQIAAWAMEPSDRTVRSGSRLNALVLLRLDEAALSAETRARAADGVLAYTAICTHYGCDVEDWLADRRLLSCACHESQFDPRDAAKVIDGPAPRPLPALPLKIVDGMLAVARPFTAPVGFERG